MNHDQPEPRCYEHECNYELGIVLVIINNKTFSCDSTEIYIPEVGGSIVCPAFKTLCSNKK